MRDFRVSILMFSNQVMFSFIARANIYFVCTSLDFDHVLRGDATRFYT